MHSDNASVSSVSYSHNEYRRRSIVSPRFLTDQCEDSDVRETDMTKLLYVSHLSIALLPRSSMQDTTYALHQQLRSAIPRLDYHTD